MHTPTRTPTTTVALFACAAFAAALSPCASHAQVTITDATFAPADWSQTSFQFGLYGGNGSASQALTGGNPDSARYITNSCGPSYSGALNAQFFEAFTYDPAYGGPLTGLTFSIDSRYDDGLQALAFVVRQGGFTWQTGYSINTSSWDTYTFTPAAADWAAMPESSVPSPTPDFSASGAPITFGFWTGNSSAGGWGYSRSGWFDNFSVTFVPAPGVAAGFVLAAPLALRRSRR